MNKPHKHAEVIKAWADGAEIQCSAACHIWTDIPEPLWDDNLQYRIKPPAQKWPETTMDRNKLYEIWAYAECSHTESCVKVANAALAYALETGHVVLPSNGFVVTTKGVSGGSSGVGSSGVSTGIGGGNPNGIWTTCGGGK